MRGCTKATVSLPLLYTSLLLVLISVNRTSAASPYASFARTPGLPSLFPRQSVCSDAADGISCGVGTFCCPTDTRCIPVDRNSSVVCCKIGEFCDEIFPIACGSTAVASDSIQCGTQCCPLGYDCGASKDRCILKAENLPPDHVVNKNQSDAAKREQCLTFLGLDEDGGQKKCSKISFGGILIGLFPGIAIGVAIMFAYIKTVEMKTRRRTIKFNGRLSASPDDLSFISQKPPPVPIIKENIAIGYSPTAERAMSPAAFQRDWKALSPADYSPNLGPVIAPRERSVSRGRTTSDRREAPNRAGTTPSPHPLAGSPLKPRPASRRTSTSSGTTNSPEMESDSSIAISQTIRNIPAGAAGPHRTYQRHLASDVDSSVNEDDDDGFSEVVIMDGTGDSLRHHYSLSHREQERGRARGRMSTDTGYTASVYQMSERSSQSFYALEPQVPPLNNRGVVGAKLDNPRYSGF